MLGCLGSLVFELGESLSNVGGHRHIDVAFRVVPAKSQTEVACTSPIFGEGVFCMQGGEEVISIGLAEILDAEAVYRKSEGRAAGRMMPDARGKTEWSVAVGSEMSLELVIG